MLYHNSFNEIYRNPPGAVRTGTEIELFVAADNQYDYCGLRIWMPSGDEKVYDMERWENGFRCRIKVELTGVHWYYFIAAGENKMCYYCCKSGYTGGEGEETQTPLTSFQITVYSSELKVPDWFKGSIMYHIFPDRFNRKGIIKCEDNTRVMHQVWNEPPLYEKNGAKDNDFFGGNLSGITEKIPYLNSLGIKAIYLNPIFESASNHRYNTGDYMKIDQLLGSEQDFLSLTREMKKYGMKLVLDGVFNHTGSNSRYFNKYGKYDSIGAFQSMDSVYYSWYKFKKYPNEYECWWGIDTLPCVNEENNAFKEYIYGGDKSVAAKWMEDGAGGWRLDVADELPDEFLEEFYKRVKSIDPEAVLIAEVWEDASNKVSYGKLRRYVLGRQFDSVMNYPLRNLIIDFFTMGNQEEGVPHRNIDAEEFNLRLLNLYNNYPREIFYSLMNFLSSHDTNRIMTLFEDWPYEGSMDKNKQCNYKPTVEQIWLGMNRLKTAWALIIALPGTPCIYYGDETGLTGYKDPFNRGTYPWGCENTELLDYFSRMNSIRNSNRVLVDGDFRPLYSSGDVYVFERNLNRENIIFAMNRSKTKEQDIIILKSETFRDLITGEVLKAQGGSLRICCGPVSFRMLKCQALDP